MTGSPSHRAALSSPFERTDDGSVAIDPSVDRDVIRTVAQLFREKAVDPDHRSYGLLYPALSDDPFEALELDASGDRSAMLTGPADVVLATAGQDTLDADAFDAWLKVFGNARRLFGELASDAPRYQPAFEVADVVYRCLLFTLPQPSFG